MLANIEFYILDDQVHYRNGDGVVGTFTEDSTEIRDFLLRRIERFYPGALAALYDYCKSLLIRAKLEAAKEYLIDYEKKRFQEKQDGGTSLAWYQTGAAMVVDLFTRGGGRGGSEMLRRNESEFDEETNIVSSDIASYIEDLDRSLTGNNTSGGGGNCAKCGEKPCGCKEGDKNKQKWALVDQLVCPFWGLCVSLPYNVSFMVQRYESPRLLILILH